MSPIRRKEPDYARMAREVLERQHMRVLQAAEALSQHVSFIRESDVLPEEWRLYQEAKAFIERRRKPPGNENAGSEREVQSA